MQRAGAVVGAALGAYGIYENTAGQGEHTTGNVTAGAVSGLLGGATVGALRGAKGGWIGAAIGAAAGAAITGSQLFSETDCLTDPVTGKFTCCNTVFNKGERQAKIGDYMFCGVMQGDQLTVMPPLVRQCLQGGQPTELSWWDGLWQDDTWTPGECIPRYCDSEPPVGTMVEYIPDTERFCWKWQYVDNGELGTIRTSDGQNLDPNDPYSVLIYRLTQEANKLKQQCGDTF
ncbi:MAG: hypothetical protein IKJ62_02990 [Alphaproteobacteria bacterium]|nr:hypothetical protein [Alphaproteobacteria bacterium]